MPRHSLTSAYLERISRPCPQVTPRKNLKAFVILTRRNLPRVPFCERIVLRWANQHHFQFPMDLGRLIAANLFAHTRGWASWRPLFAAPLRSESFSSCSGPHTPTQRPSFFGGMTREFARRSQRYLSSFWAACLRSRGFAELNPGRNSAEWIEHCLSQESSQRRCCIIPS